MDDMPFCQGGVDCGHGSKLRAHHRLAGMVPASTAFSSPLQVRLQGKADGHPFLHFLRWDSSMLRVRGDDYLYLQVDEMELNNDLHMCIMYVCV